MNKDCYHPSVLLLVLLTFTPGIICWQKPKLYLAGLFPLHTMDGRPNSLGQGVLPAVDLAIHHVNEDNRILPWHELAIEPSDSKCDMAVGTKLFFDMMDNEPEKVVLFGDACNHVTAPIARSSVWWNIWQLSYADTDPTLSDRNKYPNFFRTVPSYSDHNPARIQLLRRFQWEKVGTITQVSSRNSYANGKLTELLDKEDYGFSREPVSFSDDPQPALSILKEKDVRIIIGNFDVKMAQHVFCDAYKKNMYGAKYVWIIPGDYPDHWWQDSPPCDIHDLQKALQGHFGTDALTLNTDETITISGSTANDYKSTYDRKRGTTYSKYHGYAYDGIWAIAKSIDTVIKQHGGIYNINHFRNGSYFAQTLKDTNFEGVTGTVRFSNGDRIGSIVIKQFQGGEMMKVGEYSAHTDTLRLEWENPIVWSGKGPPLDQTVQEKKLARVNIAIYATLCTLSGLGIVVAVFFLAINIKFRRHRYIKMSSPNMNNLIIAGCVFTYTSVFLLGTDGEMIPVNYFHVMCSARMWILCIGYTLAFGAMFSKTWRVHSIFTNIKLNKKVIKDYKLFLMVAVMLCIDAIVLITWQCVDPLGRVIKDQAPETDPNGDIEIIPFIESCLSEKITIWMSVIYVYKGLLLIFGCFLAWETRQVTISALNDSKYIGMSVYNVVITCVAAVPTSFIIKDRPNAAFLIIALLIMFCTTITLCLVFVPKLIELRKDPKGEEKRIRATLRKTSKRDEAGSDMQQKIRSLADENYRYRQVLEEKKSEIRDLLIQLGEEPVIDGITRSPAHKTLAVLKGENNIHIHNNYNSPDGANCSDDECSLLSTSSATNLWPLETNLRHYTHVTRQSKDNKQTDVIELKEISQPLREIDTQRDNADAETLLIGSGHSTLTPPPPYDELYRDRSNRSSCSTVRTPSYQGLKFLNDIFSLKETAILSDSEQSEAGSVHSLPDELDQNDPSTTSTRLSVTSPGYQKINESDSSDLDSKEPIKNHHHQSHDFGDWSSFPQRERLLGESMITDSTQSKYSPLYANKSPGNVTNKGTISDNGNPSVSNHIPRHRNQNTLKHRIVSSSSSSLLHKDPADSDVIQYI